jgi:hypothetical protein
VHREYSTGWSVASARHVEFAAFGYRVYQQSSAGSNHMMIRLVPKMFFDRMEDGLDLFVNCLGFTVLHQDDSLAVVGRDGAKAYVVESAEYAAKDRPEIAIETDNIAQIYEEVSAKRPEILHPNLPRVTKRPWGALEFSLLDRTGVCVVMRQWPSR